MRKVKKYAFPGFVDIQNPKCRTIGSELPVCKDVEATGNLELNFRDEQRLKIISMNSREGRECTICKKKKKKGMRAY